MLSPAVRRLFGDTGFYNVGDWSGGAITIGDACTRLVERHLALLPTPPRRLLDIGCGLGAATAIAATHFSRAAVTGINISPAQLHLATAGRYAAADATHLSIASAAIDAVMSVEAMLHFPSRGAFFAELHRVLAPRGVAVVTDVLFEQRDWIAGWTVAEEQIDLAQWMSLATNAGLRVEHCEDITSATWLPFADYVGRANMKELAAGMRACGAHYLLARLRR